MDADRGVLDDPWEEGEARGMAIRTATLIDTGKLGLSSVVETFSRELVLLSADEEAGTVELGFKNILVARVSNEGPGVGPVETSAVR